MIPPIIEVIGTAILAPVIAVNVALFSTSEPAEVPEPPAIEKAPAAPQIKQKPAQKPAQQPTQKPKTVFEKQGLPNPKHSVKIWDRLAQCESGGNWHINTGNGYSGGLQIHPGTWNSNGGQRYAPVAYQASREQQITVGESIQATQGWNAWPACSRQLGLI